MDTVSFLNPRCNVTFYKGTHSGERKPRAVTGYLHQVTRLGLIFFFLIIKFTQETLRVISI